LSRLLCFPHAGGNAAAFCIRPRLLPEIDACAIRSPGRANRMTAPFATGIAAMVDASLPEMTPLRYRPFALFGHGMGGHSCLDDRAGAVTALARDSLAPAATPMSTRAAA
jgi:surfactin synthase thioesterase subunit